MKTSNYFLLSVVFLVVIVCASTSKAAVKVIVIPVNKGDKITCKGTLDGTRWCDNGDGTVMDMTTGLVWLQDANCLGASTRWVYISTNYGAMTIAGRLAAPGCGLSDGSVTGDWRLPTYKELGKLTHGDESLRSYAPRVFIDVQGSSYWTSTTHITDNKKAWVISFISGVPGVTKKSSGSSKYYLMPVRSRK